MWVAVSHYPHARRSSSYVVVTLNRVAPNVTPRRSDSGALVGAVSRSYEANEHGVSSMASCVPAVYIPALLLSPEIYAVDERVFYRVKPHYLVPGKVSRAATVSPPDCCHWRADDIAGPPVCRCVVSRFEQHWVGCKIGKHLVIGSTTSQPVSNAGNMPGCQLLQCKFAVPLLVKKHVRSFL